LCTEQERDITSIEELIEEHGKHQDPFTPEINMYFTNGLCKMFGDHSKQPVKNACDHITCAV